MYLWRLLALNENQDLMTFSFVRVVFYFSFNSLLFLLSNFRHLPQPRHLFSLHDAMPIS